MSPPKLKRSVLVETSLAKWWHRERALQKSAQLRCCVCGIEVKNENLGGYSGRSALSGRVYCQHCEDVGGCL